jgi:hypothetical protein
MLPINNGVQNNYIFFFNLKQNLVKSYYGQLPIHLPYKIEKNSRLRLKKVYHAFALSKFIQYLCTLAHATLL